MQTQSNNRKHILYIVYTLHVYQDTPYMGHITSLNKVKLFKSYKVCPWTTMELNEKSQGSRLQYSKDSQYYSQ